MDSKTILPPTMKALVVRARDQQPTVETVSTPEPTYGSATVRVLSANVISYMKNIFNGKRNYTFPTPLTPGSSAIGRIVAIGPDATKLQNGDLVFVDCLVRSRDNPADAYLASIHDGYTTGSKKLMRDVFRDWTYAEYTRVPLENLIKLDEKRLLGSPDQGGLSYSVSEFSSVAGLLVPYGGLRDIELQAGQTVIVAPATGPFGGYAVMCALAMGARVIAMGRNLTSLARVKSKATIPSRVETVPITGSMEHDLAELRNFGTIDAYFDIGPKEAVKSTHIKSCILALRHGGRISFMGGYKEDLPIPHNIIMHFNMRIYGKWMYERSDIEDLFKLVEGGMLPLGEKGGFEISGEFPLERWEEAWECAWENDKFGQTVVINP